MLFSLNPLLFEVDPTHWKYDTVSRAIDNAYETFKFAGRPSAKHPEASWRRMLLTQPPIKSIYGEFIIDRKSQPSSWRCGIVTNRVRRDIGLSGPDGLRVWDIMEKVITAEAELGRFEWSWHWLGSIGTLFPTDQELQITDAE